MNQMNKLLNRGAGRDHTIDVAKYLQIFLVVWGAHHSVYAWNRV